MSAKAMIVAHKYADAPASCRGNSMGYGNKIATPHLVQTMVGSRRWRRVWAICWSNVATLYVIVYGQKRLIDETQLAGL